MPKPKVTGSKAASAAPKKAAAPKAAAAKKAAPKKAFSLGIALLPLRNSASVNFRVS